MVVCALEGSIAAEVDRAVSLCALRGRDNKEAVLLLPCVLLPLPFVLLLLFLLLLLLLVVVEVDEDKVLRNAAAGLREREPDRDRDEEAVRRELPRDAARRRLEAL